MSKQATDSASKALDVAVQAVSRVEQVAVSIKESLAEWNLQVHKKIEHVEVAAKEAHKAADDSIASSKEAIARAEAVSQSVRSAADEAVRAAQEAADAARLAAQEISGIMAGI
jgi:hypothetical protein